MGGHIFNKMFQSENFNNIVLRRIQNQQRQMLLRNQVN